MLIRTGIVRFTCVSTFQTLQINKQWNFKKKNILKCQQKMKRSYWNFSKGQKMYSCQQWITVKTS